LARYLDEWPPTLATRASQPLGDGVHSRVVDEFGLSGSGAAGGIHSHFIAIIEGTDLEASPTFEILLLKGDPFTCDPL
jgi:hypothetical protein